MVVKVVAEDSQFMIELSNAGSKLVVVDFYADWCGPCQRIAPSFEDMSNRYPKSVFLKVNVDQCRETAASQGVTAMPTFILYMNKTKIDRVQGADPQAVEAKVKQYYVTQGDEDGDVSLQGHMDLVTFISKPESECLNESDEHPMEHCLQGGGGYLESDCDEQLIMSVSFTQAVKLHSLKLKAPSDRGPKTVKLFINQPRTLDFDQAESMHPVQELALNPGDFNGSLVNLRYVKFQNVINLQIFIKDNQNDSETTQIDHLAIIGSPINTTKMTDFKRVAGKKGESH